MGGGIAQLASYGLADVYLTGSPQITFWKLVFRRHTLFAMESIQQVFDGTADFGRKATCTVSRNGDLVGPVWLEVALPDLLAYDIVPTPAEGNAVDVTALAAPDTLHKDPVGNYWKSLNAGVYTNPVGFYNAVSGTYHTRAYKTAGVYVASYNSATFLYTDSASVTFTSAQIAYAASDQIESWPYMLRSAQGVFSEPTSDVRWTNSVGHAILSSVEIEIGGARIDKHYGEWLDIWSELTEKEEKRSGLWEMIGKYSEAEYSGAIYDAELGAFARSYDTYLNAGRTKKKRAQSRARTYYVPLRFCFNTTPGLYLPLVALSYHQVKYNFEFRPYTECIKAAVPVTRLEHKATREAPTASIQLYADYVFLDAPERIRMAEIQHEYLVTQLQFLGDEVVPASDDPGGTRARKYQLNFNHPVRELVWVYVARSNRDPRADTGNNWFDYGVPGDTTAEIFDSARLVLNGYDRFSQRTAPYFRLLQPYEHHTRCPSKKVHCYSFSLLSAEDQQPSGQANFSRFDTAHLHLQLSSSLPAGVMKIFAYSYNVLRIASGLAGLAFAN